MLFSWGLPLYSLIHNQLNPSYASALGVAYGFGIGCVIHFILLGLWMIIRHANMQRVELFMLIVSCTILIILTAAANRGSFVKIS